MTHSLKKVFLVAFILSIGALFLWTSSTRPSILVIHAYSAKTPWVKNINKGLRKVFKERTFYHRYYHYMNIKEYPDTAYTEEASKKTMEVINALNPDYIILVDDITQKIIGKKYINHPDIQVIYCGIKQDPKDYGYEDAKNITGIDVSLPLHILDDLLVFNIDEGNFDHQIYLTPISDSTITSQEDNVAIKKYNKWTKVKLRPSLQVKTFDDWKKAILKVRGRQEVILISNHHGLIRSQANPRYVPAKEVTQWTVENAKVPLVGLYGPFVRNGGHLAIAPSALEQGERAAKIVENLIENDIYIHELKPEHSNHFLVYLRKIPGHKPYKFKIPAVYEAFARAMHHYYD